MDRRVARTREAIRSAYFSMLSENREAKVTITEIARRANIDRKTFYLHYDSVEDILREFSEEKIRELFAALNESDLSTHSFDVGAVFEALNRMVNEEGDFFRYVATQTDHDFFWRQIQEITVQEIIASYENEVNLPKEVLALYARFFAAGFVASYAGWLKGEIDLSLEETGRQVAEVTVNGIRKYLE